jgi:3-hydroxyisobutyrate dehydrogenase-like beta-hydroxyacid dehydrogenase
MQSRQGFFLIERTCPTCGGAGQIVKGVNQLGMALISAACMEAVAFGVASGIDAGILGAAVGGENGFRREIADVAAQVVRGRATSYDAKYAELPYFLEQARVAGFKIPLTDALHAFCESGPSQWRDTMNRPYVSFWHQLMQAVQPQMET